MVEIPCGFESHCSHFRGNMIINPDFIKENILKLYPEFDRVYGVHYRKDGRLTILLTKSWVHKGCKGRNKTISYPKALMEVYLNKRLSEDETVDHIDKNPLNNDTDNLQILSRSDHASLDCKRRSSVFLTCDYCGISFEATRNQIANRHTGRKLHSFCSKTCSGKYGKEVQCSHIVPKESSSSVIVTYYNNKGITV